MASNTITSQPERTPDIQSPSRSPKASPPGVVRRVVEALASLKLTVALFAMAIVIVFAGTLAQVDQDIWQVVHNYFRTGIAWIDFQVFFPPSFFPSHPHVPGGFYFPGGWLIGGVMVVNLLAAHGIRFKAQAHGARLRWGIATIAGGCLLTWLVIASGSNSAGTEAVAARWTDVWGWLKLGLVAIFLSLVYVLWGTARDKVVERWSIVGGLFAVAAVLAYLVIGGEAARINDSSMRILWQLIKGSAAGAVLLTGCVMVFKKRAGIVLLHGGIGLMMFSELLVGTQAIEGQMVISEGETVNFVQDIREVELAIVDHADPKQDKVVVVSEKALQGPQPIRHPLLPFVVNVQEFMANSNLHKVSKEDTNLATAGNGLQAIAEETRAGAGTDTGGEVDLASAYVSLTSNEGSRPLGTYLVSQFFDEQPVTVDGKTYTVALRFKRTYKPYSLRLIDVRKDDYIGTSTPRNYSSDVQLVDPTRNVDRKVKIWMNNPLRFAGETFYQSGYQADPRSGVETTTLSVVTNLGWMIPYVGCMIVATGLLAQFSQTLLRFLRRWRKETVPSLKTSKGQTTTAPVTGLARGKSMLVPAIVVGLAAMLIGRAAYVPKPAADEPNLYAFGEIPVVYKGRTKPIDTLARNSLTILLHRETFKNADNKTQPAIRWLIDLMAKPEEALDYQVLRIDHLGLLETLGLTRRESNRYALSEFIDQMDELSKQARLARQLPPLELTAYQKSVVALEDKIGLIDLLLQSFSLPRIRPDNVKEDLLKTVQQQEAFLSREPPLLIPPAKKGDTWNTYSSGWTKDFIRVNLTDDRNINPAIDAVTGILAAYAKGDAKAFNRQVREYQAMLASNAAANMTPREVRKLAFEAFFNHAAPFLYAAWLYLAAFVLIACSWLGWTRPLGRAAFWLILFTFVIHTAALISRMYISGRPPVTNLYSASVFIGWGCVVFGLVFERFYRLGIGNVIAAISGFATLLIAHFLAGDGDTFIVLQAVLDTQFWLATHVVCITLGYSTTFVAGLLGLPYVLRGVITPSLSTDIGRNLARMIYGTLCFGLFFSFVGTVLGGLWADDSWGRFWGWDPKENGALIIVLWIALVLHARWGAMVGNRGLAVLAIAGNIATAWSMFGVNELGVGLHAYGFHEGMRIALATFVTSQLAVIALGLLPLSWWWSYRRRSSGDTPTVVPSG